MIKQGLLSLKICCFLCVLLPLSVFSQDDKILREDLERLFQSMRAAERKTLVENYVGALKGSFLSVQERERVTEVFAELRGLHMSADPDLKNYVKCVGAFYVRGEKANLLVWLGGLERLLNKSERKRSVLKNYLEDTVVAACEKALLSSSSHKWLVRGDLLWQDGGNRISLAFDRSTLVCTTRKDSILIYETTGHCLLGSDHLDGRGGTVRWPLAPDEMYAGLATYRIDLKNSGYTADSVIFHYESKYDFPIRGSLKDNAFKYARNASAPYPEFSSYEQNIRISGLFDDLSFCGGINYAGMKFMGVGTDDNPARIRIAPNDTIAVSLTSTCFQIDTNRIVAGSTAIAIEMDSGEIVHPDVSLLYTVPNRTMIVKRISEQSLHLAFKDTYHQILFDMDEITWHLDSACMEMRMSSRSGLFKATIESVSYFNDDLYDKLQGLDEINPLNGLLKCSLALGSDVFTVSEYTAFLKKPADQLRKQIILLSYDDFVDYNEAHDEVTLKQRLFDYTKCRVGKQDYDHLRFSSHPEEGRVNALLDVKNYHLTILGVDKFTISDKRNIYVEPSDNRVVMLKNRDMEFNGKLNAGMFDMFGDHLFFSYDEYKIKLPKLDSTSMYLAGKNENLRGDKVKSLIRGITGDIAIDKPDNKSGKREEPDYPVLNSTKESFVYFDDPSIQGGAYERDSFYYIIKPYVIKGINHAERFRYAFDGCLVSNIVSVIEDTLRLMKDNALGLTYQTPPAGLELYGKGRIRSTITLNRDGFTANGRVDMNKSAFRSDTILMLPGQMTARTHEIKVEAVKEQRPQATGKEVQVKYLASSARLLATSTAEPFDLYGGRVTHEGTIMVEEEQMDADGKLQVEDAVLHSKLFHFLENNIRSDRTSLSIASISNKNIRLNTSNVTAEIDLLANKGKFVNNTETNHAEFASNRYVCSFESFTWYMKDAYLNIGIEDRGQLERLWKIEDLSQLPSAGDNRFVSTDRLTDSFRFVAPLARYDLKEGYIDCHWINHIDLANGRYYLREGDLFIEPNGKIRELQGGRLLCDRENAARSMTGVNLQVQGRNTFTGSGHYLYVSEEKKKSDLFFDEIGADTSRLIFAKAKLQEENPLALNNGFRFKGNVTLHSRKEDLFFNGYVQMTVDTSFLKHEWLAVNSYLSSVHVSIPVEVENRNDRRQRIHNGIYLGTDRVFRPYGTFLSKRSFYNDDLLAGGCGQLEWKGAIRQYVIADTLRDRYCCFRYDPETASVQAFSRLNLDLKIPGMQQRAAGDIAYNLKEEALSITDMLYTLDFKLLPKMEGILQKDLAEKKSKALPLLPGQVEKIYEIMGKEYMTGWEQGKRAGSLPDSLMRLCVLDSLSMTWNPKTNSYVANGAANLLLIAGKPALKTMNIKMQLMRKRSGNQLFLYLYDDERWYYFEYADRSLYTLSSNPEYNDAVKLEKPEKKIIKSPENLELYTITLCPDSKKERFLQRMK